MFFFSALFVIRDHNGEVVARASTSSVMITDDHKASSAKSNAGVKRLNSEIEVPEPTPLNSINNTPSPKSDEMSLDNTPRKRKQTDSLSKPVSTNSSSVSTASTPSLPTPSSTISIPSFSSNKRSQNYAKQKSTAPRSRNSRSSVTSPTSNLPSTASSPNYQLNIKSPISPPIPFVRSPSASFDALSNFYNTSSNNNNHNNFMNSNGSHNPSSIVSSPIESPSSVIGAFSSPRNDDQTSLFPETVLPEIQKIIPQTGPIRGGIEVSLFGSNFVDGLVPKFGDNKAVSTICWSSRSIITQLPPSKYPGPVIVSFEGLTMPGSQIFSYFDDTDRQLIELALRVVGVKMNGKLEDARDIARRIVANGTGFEPDNQSFRGSSGNNNSSNSRNHSSSSSNNSNSLASYSTGLSRDQLESELMSCLELMNSYHNDIIPNYQLRNNEGQAMLHLAASLGLSQFCSALLSSGAHVDIQDKNGYSPLHFAALHGNEDIISDLLRHNAEPSIRTYFGQTYLNILHGEEPSFSRRSSIHITRPTLSSQYPVSQGMFTFVGDDESAVDDDYEEEDGLSQDEHEYPESHFDFAFNEDDSEFSASSSEYSFDMSSDYNDEEYEEESGEEEEEEETEEQGDSNEILDVEMNTPAPLNQGTDLNGFNGQIQGPQIQRQSTFANRIGSYLPYFRRGQLNDDTIYDGQQLPQDQLSSSEPQPQQQPQNNTLYTGSALFRSFFDRNNSISASQSSSESRDPTTDSIPNASPPNYYDIFPEGSQSNPDYSGAVIEEEKQQQEIIPSSGAVIFPNTTSVASGSCSGSEVGSSSTQEDEVMKENNDQVEPTEEEVVEIWRNNRKKIQNDRMFLFFWLPVFIFILVWVCYRTVSYLDRFDTGGRIHDKFAQFAKHALGFSKYQRRVNAAANQAAAGNNGGSRVAAGVIAQGAGAAARAGGPVLIPQQQP